MYYNSLSLKNYIKLLYYLHFIITLRFHTTIPSVVDIKLHTIKVTTYIL